MILDISNNDYANFKVINFPENTKAIGVHEINTEALTAEIFNYETEQLETKLLNVAGIDLDARVIFIQIIK